MAKRQENLEDEVKEIKEKLVAVSQREANEVSVDPQRSDRELTTSVDDSVRESLERNKRKNSIVIKNVKEGDTEDDDIKALWQFLELENIVYEKPVRIGRNRGDKPRLLRLELRNRAKKYEILKRAHKLAKSENEHQKEIFIAPDLTLMQRKEKQRLREQLKARKANGEANLAIRQGKIVVTQPTVNENENGVDNVAQPGRPDRGNDDTPNSQPAGAGGEHSLEN